VAGYAMSNESETVAPLLELATELLYKDRSRHR
jgi:hypothetical protein